MALGMTSMCMTSLETCPWVLGALGSPAFFIDSRIVSPQEDSWGVPLIPNAFFAERISEEDPKDSRYAYRPPEEGDSRSPCPALNTLANHGYLPNSGHNITSKHLVEALQHPDTYHLSHPLASFLVYGGLFLVHDFKAEPVSLHELARHNYIEHSASVVHKDTPDGGIFAPTKCDTQLLEGLLADGDLTSSKIERRRVELEKASETRLDPVHQEIARGEWALVLDIFGRKNGGSVPADFLRVWLKENRFPEGWRPTHKQGLIATIIKAFELRRGMNRFRKEHDKMLGECQEEKILAEELKSTSSTNTTE